MTTTVAKVEITINPDHLLHIIDEAVVIATEVVNLYFKTLASTDLSKPPVVEDVIYKFSAPAIDANTRKMMHETWLLARAFQDLLRAVRASLEEAYLCVVLLREPPKVSSGSTIAEALFPIRKKASSLTFPDLFEAVDKGLETKIAFSEAYDSLQRARNCLEHRSGIVSKTETREGKTFVLRMPRIKTFYFRQGAEVEIEAGHKVDAGDDRQEVEVLYKFEERQRSFAFGERISLTLKEFNEIAFACHYLGAQLATKLPKTVSVEAAAARNA